MVNPGSQYFIVNKDTGTVLDCNEGNGWVRAWRQKGGDNQKWIIDRSGPRQPWYLKNVATGKFLYRDDESSEGALRVDDQEHLWHVTGNDDEGFREGDGLFLDIKDANRDNDAIVLLYEKKGDNQVWYFREGKIS
ncbi:hypothetical protein H072_8025 [Dactylellina haptotyla CBS 200.50]|uniref:Ricin B lectin domain-containing protein n=1 Tax=Dactylellina haptotyla (strain CBS 200.50) TaxID=1284197 RepID=S8A6D0_DACHA|nr:hypothetical protein H072_8025 [Dactylellina haptotyla CBS 200.50]